MKQQFFNLVSEDTAKLLGKVEELMSMDINHPQERLLWQVRFKLMECSMFIKAAEERGQPTLFDNIPQEDPNQGRLFDDNLETVAPKKTRKKYELKVELPNVQPSAEAFKVLGRAFKEYNEQKQKPAIAIDDNGEPAVAKPKARESKNKIELQVDGNREIEEVKRPILTIYKEPIEPQAKLPAIDDVRMAFKNYCQSNGNDKGKEALTRYGVGNLSELYSKGDFFVGHFFNSIV